MATQVLLDFLAQDHLKFGMARQKKIQNQFKQQLNNGFSGGSDIF